MNSRVLVSVLSIFAGLTFVSSAQAAKELEVTPPGYAFGQIVVGEEYAFYDAYLEVASVDEEDEVTVTDVTLTGPDAGEFEFDASSCSGPIGSGWMGCYIDLRFLPVSAGVKTASLEITSDAVGSPTVVPLTGTGVPRATNPPEFRPVSLTPSMDGNSNHMGGMSSDDFNGDGRADLLTVSVAGDYSVDHGISYGQEDGTLSDPVGAELAAGGFAVGTGTGDFDGDGHPDGVAAISGEAVALINDGQGALIPADRMDTEATEGGIVVGDFDQDGELDFAIAASELIQVFPGNGDGTFDDPVETEVTDLYTTGVAVGDFRGDGSSDLAVSDYDGRVLVLHSNGDGTFTREQAIRPGGCGCWTPWGLDAADLDGDGRDDLTIAVRFENELATYTAQPDGTFTSTQKLAVPGFNYGFGPNPVTVAVGDLNGDGVPDAATADYLQDTTSVFTGLPGGNGYAFAGRFDTTQLSPLQAAIADFDGDGSQDLAIGGQTAEVALFINDTGPLPPPTPAMTVEPARLDFGSVEVGSSSSVRQVEIKSTGDGPLVVDSVALTSASDFKLQDGAACRRTIDPGASCSVGISFVPSAAGTRSGELRVSANTEAGPVTVTLTGDGAAKPVPPPPGKAPVVSFRKKPKKRYVIKTKRLRKVKVAFRANQAGARFQCRIDRRRFTRCKSPKVYRKLKPGRHVIRVRAIKDGRVGKAKAVKFRVIRRR